MNPNEDDVVDWDDMSEEDKANALRLMHDLNQILDKYIKKDDPECEDFNLGD